MSANKQLAVHNFKMLKHFTVSLVYLVLGLSFYLHLETVKWPLNTGTVETGTVENRGEDGFTPSAGCGVEECAL